MRKLWILLAFIVPFGMAFGPFSCDPEPPGYGLEFDGVNDSVNVGTLGSFGSGISEGNISFWVRTTHTASRQDVFGSINDGNTVAFGAIVPWDADYDVSLYVRDNDGRRLIGYADSGVLTDGEWHFVEIYYRCSTNTIRISVDGISQTVDIGYQETPSAFANFEYDFVLGGVQNRGDVQLRFEGQLADVRIDDGGRGGYWKFDEGSGSTASDSSGNDNHGTLHGDPVWVEGG